MRSIKNREAQERIRLKGEVEDIMSVQGKKVMTKRKLIFK